jgi:hypothetical protein
MPVNSRLANFVGVGRRDSDTYPRNYGQHFRSRNFDRGYRSGFVLGTTYQSWNGTGWLRFAE